MFENQKYVRLNDFKLFYITESPVSFIEGNPTLRCLVLSSKDEYIEVHYEPLNNKEAITFSDFYKNFKRVI